MKRGKYGRIKNVAIGVVLSPLIIMLAAIVLPALFLVFVAQFFGHVWHFARLRSSWPSRKFVLFAYTESSLWAPLIENELLPKIEEHCIVVNRSREDWKRRFPAERRALSFWGGATSYNPIAVVLRPWGRVRVFRFYEPFKQMKHGRSSPLEQMIGELVRCVGDTPAPERIR